MQIKELQKKIEELVSMINKKHKFPYPNIIGLLKTYEELGELSSLIVESTIKTRKGDKQEIEEVKEEIGKELADALIAVISLANDYGIDLEEYINKKMKKHNERWNKI